MAEVLVLVDHVDGAVKKVTLELLTLARSLGEPSAVFVGDGSDAAIATLTEYGAANIYVADDAELGKPAMLLWAEAVADLETAQGRRPEDQIRSLERDVVGLDIRNVDDVSGL